MVVFNHFQKNTAPISKYIHFISRQLNRMEKQVETADVEMGELGKSEGTEPEDIKGRYYYKIPVMEVNKMLLYLSRLKF